MNYKILCEISVTFVIYYFHTGDILVFLAGQDEIETVFDALEEYSPRKNASDLQLMVVPCYGNLPFDEQQKMFDPTPQGCRKVIFCEEMYSLSIICMLSIDCAGHKHCRNFSNN